MADIRIEAIENGQLVLYAAYVLIFVGAFLLGRMVMAEQETRVAQENLEDQRDRKSSSFLVKITRPLFTQYVVPMIRGKPFWDRQRKKYRRKIIAGGVKDELTSDEFISFKLFLIVFFPLVGGFLRAADMLDVDWFYIVASGIVGWFYPDIWVKGRIEGRQKQVIKAMPFIVDLLALSTEAGLDFIGAIGKVVEKAIPSPLVEELGQMLKEIKVGSSRQDALREMAARLDVQEVNSFVAILISADQMGASIGKVLRQQSEGIRVQRMLMAEKAGAAAAQKMLIPMMLFIVPAVFILIFAPVALQQIYPNGVP
ncbi:type II secretion system F family protein [Bdellovibrionota bacterium FG-1]